MKNLTTGELSGEPMPHDEWVKEQARLAEEEAKAKAHAHRPKHAADVKPHADKK